MKAYVVSIGLVVLASLSACSGSPLSPSSARSDGAQAAPSFSQFSDIPIPPKADMDVGQSLLLGHDQSWVGRLVYTTGGNPGAIYDLYKSDMPGFGWQEITSVRASISVQTWQRADRVATVQIRDTTLGTETIVTVAPAISPGAGAGGSAYGPPPAPTAAPQTGVSRQPIR
ncbi:MAG TPA: hypothetical protein VN809_06160 [Telmatospirillum sp.]|nr:hypothetical protein [Telmatospirillum sp.]